MPEIHLKLAWMYPDCLNLHGERGNVQAFVRSGKRLGVRITVDRIEYPEETVNFSAYDLLLFLPGELTMLSRLYPHLNKQLPALRQYLAEGGWLIATGTTGMLFGEGVLREDGSKMPGLGLLPVTGKERQYVWGDDLHFRIRDTKQEIFGSQIQMVDVESKMPLGDVLYGRGNDAQGTEGARMGNLIYTNCLGPVFVKNPWWTEQIIKDIILQKVGVRPAQPHPLEDASFASCLRFTENKPKFPNT